MPSFRDFLSSDLSTFINESEFAEKLIVDGKEITVVMDNDTLQEHKLKQGGEGLARSELLFHVSKTEFEKEPFIEQRMRINNRFYQVSDVSESDGMYTVTLAVYVS